jgi:hypothetical protein
VPCRYTVVDVKYWVKNTLVVQGAGYHCRSNVPDIKYWVKSMYSSGARCWKPM